MSVRRCGRRRLSLLGRSLPATFDLRVVIVGPGEVVPFVAADWADALVVVEHGEVDVECGAGTTQRFRTGAVLTFVRLDVAALRNDGREPAVLSAVSRRPVEKSR